MLGEHRNPYVTVVAVWIASSLGLALVISFPISWVILFSVVLSLVLAVAGYAIYKANHKDLNNRDLAKNLTSGLRRFVAGIAEDFGIVSARVSAWWLRREARIQEEMAQERERKARKREKLAQVKRRRSASPFNEHSPAGEHEDAQRGLGGERAKG
jgi:hypothetical protein